MTCPHCAAPRPYGLGQKTSQGYCTFRCRACRRTYNERTGTPFNHLAYPTDVVLLVVRWRLQYKLSLRDLAMMFLERGITFTHETVRDWEARFAPLLTARLRAKRRGKAGRTWFVDETYVKVHGRWCYLYRAIDGDGNLVDSLLSETRDMEAAECFFRQAIEVVGHQPEQVTTDGQTSYPRASKETLGEQVEHRCNHYLNNRLEQGHRGIKQRYYPMRGFGSFDAAARFCRAHDELRDHFRARRTMGEYVPLAKQRRLYLFLLEDQSQVPRRPFTALWVAYGGENPLLRVLRDVPVLGATLPIPQRVLGTATVTYRVKLHRQDNPCLVDGCVWGELLDAAPVPQ